MQTLFNKKKKKPSQDMTLQITSMADIFTIILVFLLKTTSSGMANVGPNGHTQLPIGVGQEITHDTLKVEISRDSVVVDQSQAVGLSNFEFPLNEVQINGTSQSIFNAFIEQRKHRPDPNFTSDLLVLADEDTPYSTLKVILASAANSGFVDLQLVLVQAD